MSELIAAELTKDQIRALVRCVDYAEKKTDGNVLRPDGDSARRALLAAIRPDDPLTGIA
jgi:hypothetical protein